MLLIRLFAFALGGAVAAALHLQFKVTMLWSVIAGVVAYVAIDFIVEHLLHGHIG